MTRFLVHMREDDGTGTLCGEPWQSWQFQGGEHVECTAQPRPHQDRIYQCQGCMRIMFLLRDRERVS